MEGRALQVQEQLCKGQEEGTESQAVRGGQRGKKRIEDGTLKG